MNDQTVKADAGKPKLTLVPRQIIKDICEVREYGNAKYPEGGPDNWKQVDIQRYRDALFRHFMAYLDDPHGVDEESGIEHYKHMACNMAFLCEMENERNDTSDLISRKDVFLTFQECTETSECGTALNDEMFLVKLARIPSRMKGTNNENRTTGAAE